MLLLKWLTGSMLPSSFTRLALKSNTGLSPTTCFCSSVNSLSLSACFTCMDTDAAPVRSIAFRGTDSRATADAISSLSIPAALIPVSKSTDNSDVTSLTL
ncbi:hypothetical protein D3C84_1133750 [compost metagenome]